MNNSTQPNPEIRCIQPQLILSALAASFALAACGGEVTADEIESTSISELRSGVALTQCRPSTGQGCDRGESCLSLPLSDRPDDFIAACSTGRCYTSRECGDGYVCRLDHCLAVERTEPDRPCPRGTVPGIPLCAEGYAPHYVSRDPLCASCEPTRDRCDPERRPTARGACDAVLGYFWNGRVCSPLSGCSVVSSQGLFRTARACAQAYSQCLPSDDSDRSRDNDRRSNGRN